MRKKLKSLVFDSPEYWVAMRRAVQRCIVGALFSFIVLGTTVFVANKRYLKNEPAKELVSAIVFFSLAAIVYRLGNLAVIGLTHYVRKNGWLRDLPRVQPDGPKEQ